MTPGTTGSQRPGQGAQDRTRGADDPQTRTPPADAEGFEAYVRARLEEIEDGLHGAAVADLPFVTEAAQHLIASGGKRFRPLLVVLAAAVGAPRTLVDLERAALVVELTHVASLYHDDVMDEAEVRRGVPSANTEYGNSVAILVGDFLFARASDIVVDLGLQAVRLQARTFARLVQGQVLETTGPGAGTDRLQTYYEVISGKTASLIATSARLGGMVADLPEHQLDALERYGEELGLVFQLSDDLIDVVSDDTGKTPGTDLREGIPTLPTLLLETYHDPESRELVERINSDLSDDAVLAEVLAQLRSHPVIDQSREEVARRAQVARSHLSVLPEGPARDALSELCDTVVTRST